jgi:hypothetical protein
MTNRSVLSRSGVTPLTRRIPAAPGRGATGDSYHRIEVLIHPKLMVDVGELLGYAPNKIDAGVGYEYWHNTFGNTPNPRPARAPEASCSPHRWLLSYAD